MSDLISRADAIEAVANMLYEEAPYLDTEVKCYKYAEKLISALPSAELTLQTPQTYGKSINPSNAEVVEDYISRADAICEVLVNDGIDNIVDRINALPSAEAKQGEWLYRWNEVECSVCGEFAKDKSNFCPNCGVRMKGADDE